MQAWFHYNTSYDNNDHDRGVKMTLIKKLKKYFQRNEAARPPPEFKKRNFFNQPLFLM